MYYVFCFCANRKPNDERTKKGRRHIRSCLVEVNECIPQHYILFLGFSLLFFSDDDVQCHFTQLFFQTSLGEWDRSRIGWMFMKSALLSFGLSTRRKMES